MTDRDWMKLIDRRAALREQFPTLGQLRNERPGTPAARRSLEYWQADNRRSQEAHQQKLIAQSTAQNERTLEQSRRRAANRAYKNRNKENAA